MVAVDAPNLGAVTGEREQFVEQEIHHLLAVREGVVLGPEHVGDVVVELLGVLGEVGEVAVFEIEPDRWATLRARSMCFVASWFPMPRLPECTTAHTCSLFVVSKADEVVSRRRAFRTARASSSPVPA